jgi:E3 ubiquitin-protein ligase SHPRH
MEALGRTNLRTINEVLDAMVRQTSLDLYIQEKGLVGNRVKRAVLQARINKNDRDLALFHSVDKEISQHVAIWKERLAEETTKRIQRRLDFTYKKVDGHVDYEMDDEDDDGDGKVGHPTDDPYMTSLLRHREWLLEHHRLLFFFAGAYHERDMTDEETEYYERAETIRQQVLIIQEKKFDRLSARAKDTLGELVIDSEFTIPLSEYHGGIAMSRHLDELASVRTVLNIQLEILGKWRKDLVDRLTQPLLQDGEEGEQYQYSIDLQHTLEAYLHFYSRMILLRKDLLTGTKEAMAKIVADAECQRVRESMVKRRENRVRRFRRIDGMEEEPKADEDLDTRLEKEMDSLISPGLASTLRSVRFDLKSLSSDLSMPSTERQMAEKEELRLKEEQNRQTKLILELEK